MTIDLDEIMQEMEKVPFGNSHFQNSHFTAGQEAPERRHRHIMLQLNKKVQALQSCRFRRQRIDLDLGEMDEKLKIAHALSLLLDAGRELAKYQRDKERMEIDKAEKEWQLRSEVQLINDALVEVASYYDMLQALPPLKDRVEFERAELKYWRLRLERDMQLELIERGTVGIGTLKALEQIGIKATSRNKQGQIMFDDSNFKALEAKNDVLRELPTAEIP